MKVCVQYSIYMYSVGLKQFMQIFALQSLRQVKPIIMFSTKKCKLLVVDNFFKIFLQNAFKIQLNHIEYNDVA